VPSNYTIFTRCHKRLHLWSENVLEQSLVI
jgi:hypothetical protein